MHIGIRKTKGRFLILVLVCLVGLGLLCDRLLFPVPLDRLTKSPAHFVFSRDGHLLTAFASEDSYWRMPIELDSVSRHLQLCVIETEDKWFYYHPGFNPISLITATIDNVKAGKIVRGGSTITMQIARMMEPKPRTIPNKIIEICRAVQLEMHYSKDELLELYLNLAPYGGNIEGVGAASYFYFGKRPLELTLSEAAILTAIPASPNSFRPDIPDNSCRSRRDRILMHLRDDGIIDSPTCHTAISEEIPSRRLVRPFVAPHFCRSLVDELTEKSVQATTIDYNLQRDIERMAFDYAALLRPRGIHNLSIVVLDNATGELLAEVGSPDFADDSHGGQINGALAPRSPGSALKPFVYALGLESGRITPSTRLDDIPVNYSGYTPENYDESYHGFVSAHDALVQSLNVPAVNLAADIGMYRVFDFLKDAGVTTLRGEYYNYGLPLVLGACEVSLLELSNCYGTLARGGQYIPIHNKLNTHADTALSKQLISPATSYIVANILADLNRPNLNTVWEFTADMPTIAWKTGTSYGRKDAWAIGYNPKYTVGVWTGNFSAESSPYLVGVESSAPLMIDIFRHLTKNSDPTWFERPADVGAREVCAISGDLPTEYCPITSSEYYIKGKSHLRSCEVHRPIIVDSKTGYQLCPACMHGHTHREKVVEEWPARLNNWLQSNNRIALLPKHNPFCTGVLTENAPVIISPEKNACYEIRNDMPGEFQRIELRASAAAGVGRLHWFVDNNYLEATSSDAACFYTPEKGSHTLICMDDLGRTTELTFMVQ
ncbi:MAG: penicillin-binding protein 1C [Candidatus Zixiibacteriota bacterium]